MRSVRRFAYSNVARARPRLAQKKPQGQHAPIKSADAGRRSPSSRENRASSWQFAFRADQACGRHPSGPALGFRRLGKEAPRCCDTRRTEGLRCGSEPCLRKALPRRLASPSRGLRLEAKQAGRPIEERAVSVLKLETRSRQIVQQCPRRSSRSFLKARYSLVRRFAVVVR